MNEVVPHFVVSWGGASNRLITIDLHDRPDSELGAVMAELDEAAAIADDDALSQLLQRAVSVIAVVRQLRGHARRLFADHRQAGATRQVSPSAGWARGRVGGSAARSTRPHATWKCVGCRTDQRRRGVLIAGSGTIDDRRWCRPTVPRFA